MNHAMNVFFGVNNPNEFLAGIQKAINSLVRKDGIYAGDNLFTFGRNLSFLEDKKFMESHLKHVETPVESAILWRVAVVVWGAINGMRLDEGDFVECACYKGLTARIVCDYLDFHKQTNRKYFLYDLFQHDPKFDHHAMPEHGAGLYEKVKSRFSDAPNVVVTQGSVPEVLDSVSPQKISFMHLDLNNANAEIGALEKLFDRMVPGAVLVLDDYGWQAYREQKIREDEWFGRRGYRVLELPTGQGLLIK